MNHSELSHMAGAVDDSTINIVEVIIIIIITYFAFMDFVITPVILATLNSDLID